MHTLWLKEQQKYSGEQLAPLYNYLKYGVLGDSVVAWAGACDIPFDHMIDGEDLREEAKIAGDQMLHFVLELFNFPLPAAVALQRLMGEILIKQLKAESPKAAELQRHGDDVYLGAGKLNISIATCSSNSSLIHYGVNISNSGTPVETAALEDFGVKDPKDFAEKFMDAVKAEVLSVKRATVKVRSF